MKSHFEPGKWNVICDTCGFQFKSGELKKTWDGRWVCPDDWEPRHVMDFLRPPASEKPLPYTRPEPAEIDGSPEYISGTIGIQEGTMPPPTNNGGIDTIIPDWENENGITGLWINNASVTGLWE